MICAPIVRCGVSEVSGSWKIMVIREPRMRLISRLRQAQQFLAAEFHAARGAAVGGEKAQRGQKELALARAGFADHAQAFAFGDVDVRRA